MVKSMRKSLGVEQADIEIMISFDKYSRTAFKQKMIFVR
jgi:hypothetical protein